MGTTMIVDQVAVRRRISGGWLTLTRVGTIPESYPRLTTICTPPACADDQVTAAGAANLAAMGITLAMAAWYDIGVSLVFALVYAALAILIFWRRPDDPMALYVSMTLLLFGSSITERIVADTSGSYLWQLIVALWPIFAWISFANLLYLFPDGSFTPRWTRWLALIWLLMVALPLTLNRFVSGLLYTIININSWPPLVQFGLFLLLMGGGLYAQIYRYRNTSNAVQRQQTKWVVYGLSMVTTGVILLSELPLAVMPEQVAVGTLTNLVLSAVGLVILIFLAATFVIGIVVIAPF
nr:hypothetical protein [Caldilineaceae bacterium]